MLVYLVMYSSFSYVCVCVFIYLGWGRGFGGDCLEILNLVHLQILLRQISSTTILCPNFYLHVYISAIIINNTNEHTQKIIKIRYKNPPSNTSPTSIHICTLLHPPWCITSIRCIDTNCCVRSRHEDSFITYGRTEWCRI